MIINNILVFEDDTYKNFYPFTYLRPTFDMVCGQATLLSKITRIFPEANITLLTREYLKNITKQYHPGIAVNNVNSGIPCLLINSRLLPPENLEEVLALDGKNRIFISKDEELVAAHFNSELLNKFKNFISKPISSKEFVSTFRYKSEVKALPDLPLAQDTWDLIKKNPEQITFDFNFLKEGGIVKGDIHYQAAVLHEHNIYVGKNSLINPQVVLDARQGPIYIGDSVRIDGPTLIKGPVYIGTNSIISAANLQPGCSIGPGSEITGNLEMCILHSFAKKLSPEYLGFMYAGEWVTFGIGTTNQARKNIFENAKSKNKGFERYSPLFIGDYTVTDLCTAFTNEGGTGIASHIAGGTSPISSHIPSFVEGTLNRLKETSLQDNIEILTYIMAEKGVEFTSVEKDLLSEIYHKTAAERKRS